MNNGHTHVTPERFARCMPLVRQRLADAGLSIAGEFDVSGEPHFQTTGHRSCVVLLVDTPGLLFECIAIDRAAAVFLPVHIVISGDRDSTSIHWADPIAISGLRPPMPAKVPLEDLCARIARALAGLPQAGEVGLLNQHTH